MSGSMNRLWPILLLVAAVRCGTVERERQAEDGADTTGTAQRADSLRAMAIADSLRDGYHVYRDAAGRPTMEGEMLNGERYGVWTSYRPSGRIQSRNVYENGQLNGIATVFHENGVLYYTGTYRKGRSVGEWRFYDPTGELARTVVYDTTGALINDRTRTRGTR